MTARKKPKARVSGSVHVTKLRMWTGRVVDVVFVKSPPGSTACPYDTDDPALSRCSGHWTNGPNYQCCHCGSEYRPVRPDPNLGPDATARAWRHSPPDPATVVYWREVAKEDSKRGEAARNMLARYEEALATPAAPLSSGAIDASAGVKIEAPLCGVCKEPPGAEYYTGVPTHLGPMDMCVKCWESWRKEKR